MTSNLSLKNQVGKTRKFFVSSKIVSKVIREIGSEVINSSMMVIYHSRGLFSPATKFHISDKKFKFAALAHK